MNKFTLKSEYTPQGDQPTAIQALSDGVLRGERNQTLLGVTGSGKTFTMASVIEKVQRPTLIVSHNKTLAAQLYQEFREFFPDNAVHYFVSYYDYYQPESYLPSSDTFIEKESMTNMELERLRHASTQSILSRPDTIIVASVSCIYGIGSPEDYGNRAIDVTQGMTLTRDEFIRTIVELQYTRNDIDFKPGCFRVKGDVVEIHEPGQERIIKVSFWGNTVETISFNQYQDTILQQLPAQYVKYYRIFPATHWISTQSKIEAMIPLIREEMEQRVAFFKKHNKLIEAQRIEERVKYDLEMLQEVGFTKGIENYSRYLAGRGPGQPPYTLIDYFLEANPDFVMMVDESHITLPQVRGMYNGDAARKKTLIDFGFRLPSAADNRPLRFHEFEAKLPHAIYVSATPAEYELKISTENTIQSIGEIRTQGLTHPNIVEQIVRPTGLLEPIIIIRPTENQIQETLDEIEATVIKGQRVLVLTLTKRMAEDLADFMKEREIKAAYLHSEIDTLDRPKILQKLRQGVYDVLIGINLLREGIDLPEVSRVMILDADKEGFLRNETSLIQTIGRAARHQEGTVTLFADKITKSIQAALDETARRKTIQEEYNKDNNITPRGVTKSIRQEVTEEHAEVEKEQKHTNIAPEERDFVIAELQKQMAQAAKDLDFERAANLRDEIKALQEME